MNILILVSLIALVSIISYKRLRAIEKGKMDWLIFILLYETET